MLQWYWNTTATKERWNSHSSRWTTEWTNPKVLRPMWMILRSSEMEHYWEETRLQRFGMWTSNSTTSAACYRSCWNRNLSGTCAERRYYYAIPRPGATKRWPAKSDVKTIKCALTPPQQIAFPLLQEDLQCVEQSWMNHCTDIITQLSVAIIIMYCQDIKNGSLSSLSMSRMLLCA